MLVKSEARHNKRTSESKKEFEKCKLLEIYPPYKAMIVLITHVQASH